jgi:DNA-binding NarL/FixJ family response regulator
LVCENLDAFALYFQARQQLHLTERELEVLQWLVQGAGNDEIAKKLYITVATVKAHLTSIFEKLNVTSRTQAIVAALKLGLVASH